MKLRTAALPLAATIPPYSFAVPSAVTVPSTAAALSAAALSAAIAVAVVAVVPLAAVSSGAASSQLLDLLLINPLLCLAVLTWILSALFLRIVVDVKYPCLTFILALRSKLSSIFLGNIRF